GKAGMQPFWPGKDTRSWPGWQLRKDGQEMCPWYGIRINLGWLDVFSSHVACGPASEKTAPRGGLF
ncbi:MAG: hypothetical protein ACOCQT_05110, partial [Desulfovermiculus sp.]